MEYRLDPRKPMDREARRVFREQVSLALADLENPDLDPDVVVHEVRKRLKRVRALLRLFRSELGAGFSRRNTRLRDAGARLSYLRDARVSLDTLDRLTMAYRERLPEEALKRLERARRYLDSNLPHEVRSQHFQEVKADVIEELEPIRKWSKKIQFDDPGWDSLEYGLRRTYRQARAAMELARDEGEAEDFHDWRKRVKDHWHHMELLGAVTDRVMASRARRLHDLSELLGDFQDLQVLEEALTSRSMDPRTRAVPLTLVEEERVRLKQAALDLGSALFFFRPGTLVKRLRTGWDDVRGPSA